jgi:hypothetical protein
LKSKIFLLDFPHPPPQIASGVQIVPFRVFPESGIINPTSQGNYTAEKRLIKDKVHLTIFENCRFLIEYQDFCRLIASNIQKW